MFDKDRLRFNLYIGIREKVNETKKYKSKQDSRHHIVFECPKKGSRNDVSFRGH